MSETRRIGVIMNGVTGRMGTNQHLIRSILAIRQQGGARAADGTLIVPEPVLVGRNADKLRKLAETTGVARWTTDADAALADAGNEVYFDAQTTQLRAEAVRKAVAAGKHVYCEKPTATTAAEALELWRLADAAGVKSGVVQDKLWLPGLLKLRKLIDEGFFGRILSVRAEFGYWVFPGERQSCQRPSWNYRKEDGGGIISDMFSHWRYVLDELFGQVRSVACTAATHIPRRWDEQGKPYDCTAEDAAYAIFELAGGVVAQFNSSWVVRVRRDDLLVMQVEGTEGTAVAGLRDCRVQPRDRTPRVVWNPDIESQIDYFADWTAVEQGREYDNAFKAQWELFLRHVACGEPFGWTLLAGAKGVQLAELAHQAWRERRWVDVPPLE